MATTGQNLLSFDTFHSKRLGLTLVAAAIYIMQDPHTFYILLATSCFKEKEMR